MPVIGYNPSAVVDEYATVGTANSLNQRAYVGPRMTEDGWFYQIGIRGGRVETTIPRVALAIWSVGQGTAPDQLVGRTAEFTTGTYMLNASDGTEYINPLQTAAMGRSGKRYAFGFNVNDAQFGFGIRPKANLPTDEIYDVFRRTVATGPTPQDPFGTTSIGTDVGWLSVWVAYEANVAPDVPTSTSPSGGASVSSLTPTFAGDFRDDNETLVNGLAGDTLQSVQIQVRIVGTTSLLWNHTYNATAAEVTNRRFSIAYAGTTLSQGTTYEWRSRVSDQFGAWSDYTAWTSFEFGAGYVTNDTGTPTGKQETRTPGPFTGIWHHQSGTTAAAAQIEIVNTVTNAVVRSSPMITLGAPVTVENTISIPWASTGFVQLDWGGQYAYRMRVDDSLAGTSNWSGLRSFHINAAPTIPVLVAPLNGAVVSSRPELVATSTDADSDDLPGAGHTVSARIKDSAGTVLFTRTMTYDAVSQTFRYQTTPTDLAGTGAYRWDAWAHDGTVYSSGNTVLGAAALSTEATFTYSSGPAITHVDPTENEVIDTDTPVYDWTVTDQVRFRVRVFDSATDLMIYDSGEVTSGTTQHRQPSGYLDNGGGYYRIIDVWNSLNQQGTSEATFFSVDFDQATNINNFAASLFRARHDVDPTAVLLSWDQTGYTTAQFQRYIITRRAVAGDIPFDVDDTIQDANRRIAEITTPGRVSFVDYLPASGVSYVYGIRQIVEVDETVISSDYVHAETSVTFQDTVICDARQGGVRRAVLQAREDRETDYEIDQVFRHPWGSTAPVEVRTNRFARVVSGIFPLVADTVTDAEIMIKDLEQMHYRGGPLCYRDGRGNRYFGSLEQFRRIDPPGGRVQRVQIVFRQTNAYEAVVT